MNEFNSDAAALFSAALSGSTPVTVCAVVVTYNRKALLCECLSALMRQTKRLDAIWLIDNSSPDDTAAELMRQGFIDTLPPEAITAPYEIIKKHEESGTVLHYLRMDTNTGGTGGYYEGIRRAYESGFHWIWTMDDDVEPKLHALETLLSYSNMGECIQPSRVYTDGQVFQDNKYIDLSTGKQKSLKGAVFAKHQTFSMKNFVSFEGLLISRNIIKEIGYPDRRFYCWCDDFAYGLMASLYTNIVMVKEGLIIKKIKPGGGKVFLGRKSLRLRDNELYYMVRNQFIIFEYLKKLGTLSSFAYISLFATVLRLAVGTIVYERSPGKLLLLFKGFIDGLLKKYNNINYSP
ncbi:MAG: glycosyltransferase [Nitrospirae bacterium]|nr:glycosyltransferase [Nitrospirota bacterium]